jgi:DNA polymerase-1
MAAPLLAVDTPWLLYRSFFALPHSIVDREDRPVGALLGTVNAILLVVEACAPRAVAACFGAEQAAYRVELYPGYHAHRDPMPEALAAQWARAPQLLESLGWTVLDTAELEADDLMFSLARIEEEAGGEALILSGDRDMFQAVSDHVAVLELSKGAVAGRVGPGDPSDGLPGASGIGPKTARDLLVEHGSLEAAIARSHRERPRVGHALRSEADQLRDFRTIATLVRVELSRPADRPTDYAGGALAAREAGLARLAGRLERLAARKQARPGER